MNSVPATNPFILLRSGFKTPGQALPRAETVGIVSGFELGSEKLRPIVFVNKTATGVLALLGIPRFFQ